MSKMKHLLRKLHIGNDHQRLPSSETNQTTPSQSSSSSPSPANTANVGDSSSAEFNFFEEEFQMQLALAISVSDPKGVEDPEVAQIKAAKQRSLGRSPDESLVEFLSLRYWSNNVVNYDEKVMDGFYDVYGTTSNLVTQGKMPLLADLKAISISDNINYEVILVNRVADSELQQLEESVYNESLGWPRLENMSSLIQKIAQLVVDKMGGPSDADEMLKRWQQRSSELRKTLNTIVLPLGCLDVGLSRHRALLFKVLADRINLPCMLVKGSYYTGTDEGAVNLVKVGNGSEYIIDLMGAPGTLIPAEAPSSHLQNFGIGITSVANVAENFKHTSRVVEKETGPLDFLADLNGVPSSIGIQSKGDGTVVEKNQTERFEHDFGRLLPSLCRSPEGCSGLGGKASPAQKLQVKDVSKCVISAAKNPDFAQKLHAVLSSENREGDRTQSVMVLSNNEKSIIPFTWLQSMNNVHYDSEPRCLLSSDTTTSDEFVFVNNGTNETSQIETDNSEEFMLTPCTTHNQEITPVLGEVAEWEIPWEDLQIGERIGIGSYGEVYRAEWNGTEVAVKKFMDQDISGDALVQFKCEVEIMLRLRHPNVVLFMGAVTRPPNLSILTEFLPRGSLYKLLHRPNIQLDEKRRVKMAFDVAKGMNYLHTSNPIIVHRDLKTPNLLVDKSWVVKVCDFGMSRMKNHTFLSSTSMAGTPEWMAPEVLRNEPSNEKCDVYSFGVILWELTTLRVPWAEMNSMQVVGAVGFQHRHLDIPEDVDPMVAQIITDCWAREPQSRPSFAQIIPRLRSLKRLIIGRGEETHRNQQ